MLSHKYIYNILNVCGSLPALLNKLLYLSENSQGNETEITGTSGVIRSPNYPRFYPDSFDHEWTISVSEDSTIELTIKDFETESSTDVLTVS